MTESSSANSGASPERPAAADATDVPAIRALRVWQRFHVKLSLAYAALVFTVLGVMGAAFYVRAVDAEVRALQGRLHAIAVSVASGLHADEVLELRLPGDRDRAAYRRLVTMFARVAAEEGDITSIYVLRATDVHGSLEFSADWVREGAPGLPGQRYDATRAHKMLEGFMHPAVEEEAYADEWGVLLSGYAPVRDLSGRAVAIAGVDVKASSVEVMKRNVLLLTAILFGLAMGVLALLSGLVANNVRAPLTRIIEATSAISSGRLRVRANLLREDEFGILGQHFDQMARGLEERELIRATFGRYVSEEVARRVLASDDAARLGGEEREVTILFTDIRSYSTISEHLTPTQVIEMLNAYLDGMNTLIDAHGGCVIEFLGDAILAAFGAPGDVEDHASQAALCAIEMRKKLGELNVVWEKSGFARRWKDNGVQELVARIGVHSGRVIAGNMGSAARVKYAVIGDAVNVASRVENLNERLGSTLLITQETYNRLRPEVRAKFEDFGAHEVKGRSRPVEVYRPIT